MKKIIYLILFIFFFSQISAQKQENSKFSADLKIIFYSGLGDKYFNQSFSTSPGINLKFKYKINQKFGLFFDLRNVFIKTKNPEIFGDFSTLNFANYNVGGSYTHTLNPKLDLEGNLFLGGFEFMGKKNGNESQYSQNGFSYGIGADAIYHFDKKGTIDLLAGIEYQNLNSNLEIENAYYKDFYNRSAVLIPNFGIRFNF